MDPLKLIFPELHDLIFSHFSVRELKSLTLVSKLWNGQIANSKCLNRFVFSVYENSQENLDSTLKVLLATERRYKNISINLNNFAFNDSFENCGRLTFNCVRYSYGILPKSLSPLTSIEEHVKVLEITKMICETEEINFGLKFPRLENLSLYCNYGNVNKIFEDCENLKLLSFTQQNNSDSNEVIEKLLKNNKNLKVLKLNLKDGEAIKKVMKSCKFELLSLTFNSSEDLKLDLRETLMEIIETQLNSLTNVTINRWCGVDVLQKIFCIKNLNFVSLNIDHGRENIYEIFVPLNTSVNHINIEDMKVDSELTSKIIKSVPNLTIFKTILMQFDEMIEIEKNCKNIQELYVENFYVEKIPNFDFFKNLKIFKTLDVDDVLLKNLMAKESDRRSPFEKLIYSAYFTHYVNNSS